MFKKVVLAFFFSFILVFLVEAQYSIFLPVIFKPVTQEINPLDLGKCMTVPLPKYTEDLTALNVDCFYTWHYKLTRPIEGKFIPMVRTLTEAEYLYNNPEQLQETDILLLFNECDADPNAGQCVATPEEAVYWTRKLQEKFPNIKYWGSPATHCDGVVFYWACHNKNWLNEYLALCTDCQIDFITFHYYGIGSCSLGQFEYWLNKYKSYNKDLWLTEFACLSSNPETRLTQTQIWYNILKNDPQVLAVFPWTTRVNPDTHGWFAWSNYIEWNLEQEPTLTELGQWYRKVN